jgi:membrane-associated protease RseP (regulator of RpoE activity)
VDQVPTYRLRYLGLEVENVIGGGVRIAKVFPKTPASDAKLEVSMQIVQAGELEIKTSDQLRQQLSIAELDQPFKLKIIPAATDPAATDPVAAKAIEIETKVVTWPTVLEPLVASRRSRGNEAELKVEDIELTLGDFPNKAWAWCPESKPNAADSVGQAAVKVKEQFGLLILLPEPGDLDRNKLREIWLPLMREGWCVAVVQSGNKSRWSSEEIELVERVRGQVHEKRSLDAARTVVGGQGVGGRLALVAARASKGKINGVLTLGTPLENAKLQRENSPSDSMHFLLVGAPETFTDLVKQLQEFGYPAFSISAPELAPSKWDTTPVDRISQWLLGLGRL